MADYKKGVNSKLKGVEVQWVKIKEGEEDEYKGSKKWTLDALLPEALSTKLASLGFRIRKDKDGKDYIRCVRHNNPKNGPIKPKDVTGKHDLPDNVKIGNGSICNVGVYCRLFGELDEGDHVSMFINSIQVLKLETFEEIFEDESEKYGDGMEHSDDSQSFDDVPF